MFSCFSCYGDDEIIRRQLRISFEKIRSCKSNPDLGNPSLKWVDKKVIIAHLPNSPADFNKARLRLEQWQTAEMNEDEFVEAFCLKACRDDFMDDEFSEWVKLIPVLCNQCPGSRITHLDVGGSAASDGTPCVQPGTEQLLLFIDQLKSFQEQVCSSRLSLPTITLSTATLSAAAAVPHCCCILYTCCDRCCCCCCTHSVGVTNYSVCCTHSA